MFGLKHLFALIALTAVWSLAYAVDSAWVGTAIVVATATAYAFLNFDAARNGNTALLIFSIAGTSWMIFWLGFVAETNRMPPWKLPELTFSLVHFGNPPKYDTPPTPDKVIVDTTIHSLLTASYNSARMRNPNERILPKYPTAMRLSISVTSVIFGLLLAPTTWLIPKPEDAG